MTEIQVPDQMPLLEPLPTTVGAITGVLTNVRAAATTTSDAYSTTSAKGIPGDWSGVTATSAGYAFSQFGKESDAVTAALEKGSLALDVYSEQVGDLTTEFERIDADRTTFNWGVITLIARINTGGADADEAQVAAFQAEARKLVETRHHLDEQVTALWTKVNAAEDRLVSALQSVDADDEATSAAARPGRVDVPGLLSRLDSVKDDPTAVHDFWMGLTPAEREALKIHSPEVVGNTNGIPTGDRDEANRSQLEKDEEYLQGLKDSGQDLTDAQEQELKNVQAAQDGLDKGAAAIDPHTGLPVDTNLIVYQPNAFNGDGAVAIAYGDPDTADNTAVVVPGLTNDGSTIGSQGEDALNLMKAAGGDESTAVIAWMGYDAPSGNLHPEIGIDYNPIGGVGVDVGGLEDLPNLLGVGNEDLATAGGHNLSSFVDGLRATHEGERGNLSVIGHSYGSTTAAHAASDDGIDADSLTLLGSPGAGHNAPTAADLGMPPGKVYVGAAEHDPVTWLGDKDSSIGLGADPSQADYGATRIEVNNGQNHHVDDLGGLLDNHTSYFDPDSNPESVNNLGAIIRGDDPTTIDGRDEPARDHLKDYIGDEKDYWVQRGIDEAKDQFNDHVVDPIEDGVGAVADAGKSAYDNTIGRLPWP